MKKRHEHGYKRILNKQLHAAGILQDFCFPFHRILASSNVYRRDSSRISDTAAIGEYVTCL